MLVLPPVISPSVSLPLGARPEESGGSKLENPSWMIDNDDGEVSGMRCDEARDGDKESDDAGARRGEGEDEVRFHDENQALIITSS